MDYNSLNCGQSSCNCSTRLEILISALPYNNRKIPLKNKSKHVSKKQNMNRNILKVRFLEMFYRKISKNQIFKPEYGKKQKQYGCLFGMCVVAHLSWPTSKIRGGGQNQGLNFCVCSGPPHFFGSGPPNGEIRVEATVVFAPYVEFILS